jgi:hypothetical protein
MFSSRYGRKMRCHDFRILYVAIGNRDSRTRAG